MPKSYTRGGVKIVQGDVLEYYSDWPAPVAIISDGPYGVKGYPGDPPTAEELEEFYEPHIAVWSKMSTPQTTLWFWNTEVGWANVHSVLVKYGWTYRCGCVWDKGIGHIAGNINTESIRRLPAVTEVCVHYVKEASFTVDGKMSTMKEWLRHEWQRSGLPLYKTNEACGVINAATRKYFTQCHLWYYPPVEMFYRFSEYANAHGDPEGKPYFSLDGKKPLSGEEWGKMRAKFTCEHGVTNVWREPPVRGNERLKNGLRAVHSNQKPLRLLELTLRLCTDIGDVVWEPFGGLCTCAIASYKMGRKCYSAEINNDVYQQAIARLGATEENKCTY
jgi:site-specific DNA-methyltransferase (adenine-specific)